MQFKVFKDSKDLIEFANKFVIFERLSSLKRDVKYCLKNDCTFPALLYCFSTIDLLGALYTGYALGSSHTKENFKNYAVHFLKDSSTKYNSEQVDLLQGIFRHKIVHLAQPKIVIKNKGRYIAWRYEYPAIKNHLRIESCACKQTKNLLTPKTMYYDHIFVISITKLSSDIIESVTRPSDGYMAKLKKNYKNLQSRFDDAIYQIYDTEMQD